MFKNMGGNIAGWIFLGGNFPGGSLMRGSFPDTLLNSRLEKYLRKWLLLFIH